MEVAIPDCLELVAVQGQKQDAGDEGRVYDDTEGDVVLDEGLDYHPGQAAEGETYYACKCVHSFPAYMVILVVVSQIGQNGTWHDHIVD